MNPETWVASGHVGGFSDPLIDCKECKTRHRADKLIEEWAHENGKDMIADGMTDEELINFINENKIPCPSCGKTNFTDIRKFNLMFKTFQGVTEDTTSTVYLRPETAQGIFVDFKNVLRTSRKKMPMGIAQIGNRTDYDLTQHMNHSKQDLSYQDPETNEKYVPYVIEPSLGADRVVLAFLCNAYDEEEIAEGDTRVVLHLHPALAPYKVAVLPLSKKLSDKAEEVYSKLAKKFMCDYDAAGSIGKRYRREDEIGTPYCVTVDFDTLEDESVTVRDRDTMEQVRVKIDDLETWIAEKIEF